MVSSETSPLKVELILQDVFAIEAPDNPDYGGIIAATWQKWVQTWLEELKLTLPASHAYELSLRLTGDRDIQTFNAQYRDQDQPTDVLAFAALEVNVPDSLEEAATDEPLYLGDLIISVETAQKQAQQNHHSLTVELAWLTAHGLLHLLGWDHPDEPSLQKMFSQQETLLKLVGLQLNS